MRRARILHVVAIAAFAFATADTVRAQEYIPGTVADSPEGGATTPDEAEAEEAESLDLPDAINEGFMDEADDAIEGAYHEYDGSGGESPAPR